MAGTATNLRAIELLRRALEHDPQYNDAKYWLATSLLLLPDWYEHRAEIAQLADELLVARPDDAYVNRLNAFVVGRLEGDTPDSLQKRERLLRRTVELMPNNSDLLVDLALFYWQADLARDALDVMHEWAKRNPGIVSPLLAQLELSFDHDPELAAHYADVVLANGWGGPHHVAPYYQIRNDFVTPVELVSRPAERQSFGDDTWAKTQLAGLLMSIDRDAAMAWLDWLDAKAWPTPVLKPMRIALLMLKQDRSALAGFVTRWETAHDPAAPHGRIMLEVLDARLATDESSRREHLANAYRLGSSEWGSPGRLTGFEAGWSAIGYAMLAAHFDPEVSARTLEAVRAHYAAGAAHWNIGDKYAVLTLLEAMSGDVNAALAQFERAESYGFRDLYRYELLGVFLPRNDDTLHGLAERTEFKTLVARIEQRNQQTLAAVRERVPDALHPECHEPGIAARPALCSAGRAARTVAIAAAVPSA